MGARSLGGIVLMLVMLGSASAQVRLAEISGTITDESGAILPGVTLTATHVATQQSRTAVTEESGRYLLTALPVGVYEVRVELSGFTPVLIQDYRLGIGESARLDVKLRVANLQETLTVTAEAPLIDPTKSDLSGKINQAQVEELPVNGRNWLNFAALAPGVKSDDRGGQPTAGVGDSRMSKVFVDGGSVQNLSTVAIDLEVSKEIIGEFEVITNRFDAVMGRAGTSIVNAVTKAGTDRLSGSAFFYFRDDSLNAKDFFTNRVEPYQNKQFGATAGGPIVRGKTHVFGSYERQVEPKTLSANTGIPIFDVPVDSTDTRNLYFVRGDHSFTSNHRFSAKYNHFDRFQPTNNVGGTLTISNSTTNDFVTDRVNFGISSVFGSKFVNQLQITYLDSFRQFNRFSGAPAEELLGLGPLRDRQYSFPSITIGGRPNVGNEQPYFWTFRNDASYFWEKAGQHNLKFGAEFTHQYIKGIFASNSNGTFFYNQDPPNLATCCAGGDQLEWDISRFPIPVRYTQTLGNYFYDAPNDIYAGFFQDDWTVHSRLTLNLGLRYDLEIGSLGHDQNGLVTTERGNDKNNFQPRVGFAWDITGKARTIVRGGGGLYYDNVFLNVTFNQRRSNTGAQVAITTNNTTNDPRFATDPLGGRTFEDFKRAAGATNVSRIADDATQPHVWSGSIGIAHQITEALAISADYVGQRSDSMLRSIDTNLFCCLPDGNARPVVTGNYPELGGAIQGAGRPDTRFNAIQNYTSGGRSRYHGLQMALTRRMKDNYQYGVTYLLSRNRDNHNGAFSYPNNMFDQDAEFGVSLQDQRHRLVANWVSRLPYGIHFGGILLAASGQAVGVTTGGVDVNGDGTTGGDRPVCGVDPRFAPGCTFLGIANGTRVPRNALRSDPVYRMDLRVSRRFKIARFEVDPTLEVFNIFNRRNYDPTRYNNSLASARFGAPGRSDALPYLPRQMQVAVRTTW